MSEEKEEPKALDIQQIVSMAFESLDESIKSLELIPANAMTKTEHLVMILYDRTVDIFDGDGRTRFLNALNALYGEIGHANHTVLEIELARQRVKPLGNPETIEIGTKDRSGSQQVILQPSAPQNLGALATYFWSKAIRDNAKASIQANQQNLPQITTSKKPTDILDYGRDLISEFNKVQTFYRQSIDHLYFFHDIDTTERLRSEISQHMNKLAGIIYAFCRTISEYRKELVGDRKADIAKSALMLQIIAASQSGGVPPTRLDSLAKEMWSQRH